MFILKSLQIGLRMLVAPKETADLLFNEKNATPKAWFFLIVSTSLWMGLTLYTNLILKSTSRGREAVLGISFGPDMIISLLTVPLGIGVVLLISFLSSKLFRKFKSEITFQQIFTIISFSLCAGSLFFDLPHEIGWAVSTQAPWNLMKVFPGFFIYTAVVMFGSILWSLIATIIALSYAAKIGILKTIIVFLISILPVFSLLIFIVM